MSGHSKWANIKHRKAAQDAKRGNLFQKLVRAIIVAAKEGGGDPGMNVRLKTAIDRAKAASVPNENITRAIKRGTGEIEGAMYEEITYEGYGSNGVALMIEALTDNRNRTAADMRAILTRGGGALGESGCVAWMFERKGVIEVKGENIDEETIMLACLDAGAEDFEATDEGYTIFTTPSALTDVQKALEDAGYAVERAEAEMIPNNTVAIETIEQAQKILRLLETLEDHDDIQNVYANFDIPDEIMAQVE
ncbi:MAG: YebC/PmpR family DNA-binding transcriptional regulator [Aminobacterium sp.]|uniref:YebC/PmpR family DNA-binding transcriptional regulator n=1 Tax=unclassified Aminobacterium TaxID=2685012 RepID=UPI001BCC9514|nr:MULTISPECIES: YebC/PmpR family DNA-binding transcriptional regulator [unclassified Aminobacterium]MDD2207022.1 YebC/PmpR family DNA-binding transcriptional regulator [Aminobacterium sp.]MDD3425657.1 YebC/PmpR family DNA-binding transcriptional regulator [Aminobacterium sp.]MDD3708243.1 YebC/PmpR family DNA-binding transcriptional regulator [Aminobacterium sp.]MDD4228957.1 YebC/PmpR family DNA-binding transcriptional regulator [Aminobacterium sp.]MDD4551899.1 YebC/PmpR family DNA-binding tra